MLERSSTELNLAHYRVLSAVASGDQRASRVAARLALGKPTISAAVDALCARGLLDRSGDAEDQRAAALTLTDAGLALLDRTEAGMTERLRELCAATPEPDQALESLAWLDSALETLQGQRGTGRSSDR
jgi:DNA-binding MarR family transcriptional regulator